MDLFLFGLETKIKQKQKGQKVERGDKSHWWKIGVISLWPVGFALPMGLNFIFYQSLHGLFYLISYS